MQCDRGLGVVRLGAAEHESCTGAEVQHKAMGMQLYEGALHSAPCGVAVVDGCTQTWAKKSWERAQGWRRSMGKWMSVSRVSLKAYHMANRSWAAVVRALDSPPFHLPILPIPITAAAHAPHAQLVVICKIA